MDRLRTMVEQWYKPLFVLFLVIIVGLSYQIGRSSATAVSAHGVIFSCDKDTLNTLSMEHLLESTSITRSSGPAVDTGKISGGNATFSDSEKNSAHNFLASKNGTKYYPAGCSAASRIKDENKVWFDTEEDAQLQGYTRTTLC